MLERLSKSALGIEPSITLEISAKAKAMKESGIDVLSFGVGEPDFITPENIRKAAIDAIEEGFTKYTPSSGILELKDAICEKLKKDNDLYYKPSNILVSNGAKHSIYNALMSLINPGDEVIIGAPYWVSYPELVKLSGGVPVFIDTNEMNDFKFSVDDLNRVKTNKTKILILNTPNNPTGAVYDKDELREIADWAVKNDVFILSDEIYEKLTYDNIKHTSIASISKEVKDLTIIINGMSKSYAMTGWRIGYTAAHEDIIKVMSNIQSQTTSNPSSISQYASIEALKGNQDTVEYMKTCFEKRRNMMFTSVNEIEGLSCNLPKGSFYIMVNYSELIGKTICGINIKNSIDFTNLLLEKANVAVVPGVAFGYDEYVRVSYAMSMNNIEEGLRRIKNIIEDK